MELTGEKGGSRSGAFLDTLHEQWPSLCYIGYACWMGWIFLSFRSFELTRGYVGSELAYTCMMSILATLSAAITMFCFSVGWRRLGPLLESRLFMPGVGGMAAVGMLIVAFAAPHGALFIVAGTLVGVGTSIVCLKVGVLYSKLGLQVSIVNAALSIVLAVFFYYCGIGLPQPWRPVFVALLPLMGSFVMMLHPPIEADDPAPAEVASRMGEHRAPLVRLLAANAVVALISGLTSGYLSGTVNTEAFMGDQTIVVALVGLVAVCMAFYVSWRQGIASIGRMYTGLMTVGIAVLLLRTQVLVPALLFDVTKESLRVLFLCLFAYFSFKFCVSPVKIYGLGQATFLLAHSVGWAIGFVVLGGLPEAVVVVGIGGGILMLVTLSFVCTQQTVKSLSVGALDLVKSGFVGPLVPNGSQREGAGEAGSAACAACMARAGEGDGADAAARGANAESGTGAGSSGTPAACDAAAGAGAADAPDAPALSGDTEQTSLADYLQAQGLSKREIEIAQLFLNGFSARWIGDELYISESTVRSHLHTIYSKLNVHSRKEFRALFGDGEGDAPSE